MDFLAANTAGLWAEWFRPILLLVVGLGAVIFVHELGHFLVAKLVGIKVERFALGFGPRLLGYKGKETDYCINLLPLGGYVKMLDQDDFKPLAELSRDPRAFYSKSVGARFAVISAGVVMNIVFAAVLFIVVCLAGIRFYAPVVGGVSEGYPAQEAVITWHEGPVDSPAAKNKLQSGDQILAIDGKPLTRFQELFVTAALADPDDVFRMKVRRETDQGDLVGTTEVGVRGLESPSGSGAPVLAFGILRPEDTVFGKIEDRAAKDDFLEGDRVVRVGDREVRHLWDIKEVQDTVEARPLPVVVERGGRRVRVIVHPTLRQAGRAFLLKDGRRLRAERVLEEKDNAYRVRLKDARERLLKKDTDLAPEDYLLDILGCHPRIKVVGVRNGSPAGKAGLLPGDILVDYGDRGAPSYHALREINKVAADKGTSLAVQRDGETVGDMWVVPTVRHGEAVIGINASVDMTSTVVAGVRKASPADKAGIMPGDLIVAVSASPAAPASQPFTQPTRGPATRVAGSATRVSAAVATLPATRPATRPGTEGVVSRPVKTWADLLSALKEFRGREVTITCRRGSLLPQARIGTLSDDIFDPDDYQVVLFESPRSFLPLMGPEIKKGPLAAVVWGAGETWLFILQTYATLRSLIYGTVSHKEVIGPVGMGGVAVHVGRQSITKLIYFMAMISVSLAVINFLPIPVVDGGHAVFLIIEKVRGKPVPVRIMNIVQVIGLALLLGVFVYVTWNDISRMLGNLW